MINKTLAFCLFTVFLPALTKATTSNPTEIIANTITLLQKEDKIIAKGNVISTQEDKLLKSQELQGFFQKRKEEKSSSSLSSIRKLVAYPGGKEKFVVLTSPDIEIICSKDLTYHVKEELIIAQGNAQAKNLKKNYTIQAPKITASFQKSSNQDINTKKLHTLKGFNGVVIIKETQTAKGDKAVYDTKKDIVELFGNVTLTDQGKKVTGSYGYMDINKGITQVFSNKPSKKAPIQKNQVRMLLFPK